MTLRKLLVIVPYRDRESHLHKFVPYIHNELDKQKIEHTLVIVEQKDNRLFNRGMLCNIGFLAMQNNHDYICLHDIDMIGENFDYRYEPIVTHLSALEKRRNYEEWYKEYLGGVTLFPKYLFFHINGFSNNYWGWGKEDDDLKLRCDIMRIKTQRKLCKYYTLDHPTLLYHERPTKSPGYLENKSRLDHFAKTRDVNLIFNDGLSTVAGACKIHSQKHSKDFEWIQIT